MDDLVKKLGFEIRQFGSTSYVLDDRGWPVRYASTEELALWEALADMHALVNSADPAD